MTKMHLARTLARANGLSVTGAAACVDTIIEAMKEALSRGEGIELRGLGTFRVRKVGEKRTGVAGTVPAHGRAAFRPCRSLREAVRGLGGKGK